MCVWDPKSAPYACVALIKGRKAESVYCSSQCRAQCALWGRSGSSQCRAQCAVWGRSRPQERALLLGPACFPLCTAEVPCSRNGRIHSSGGSFLINSGNQDNPYGRPSNPDSPSLRLPSQVIPDPANLTVEISHYLSHLSGSVGLSEHPTSFS